MCLLCLPRSNDKARAADECRMHPSQCFRGETGRWERVGCCSRSRATANDGRLPIARCCTHRYHSETLPRKTNGPHNSTLLCSGSHRSPALATQGQARGKHVQMKHRSHSCIQETYCCCATSRQSKGHARARPVAAAQDHAGQHHHLCRTTSNPQASVCRLCPPQ